MSPSSLKAYVVDTATHFHRHYTRALDEFAIGHLEEARDEVARALKLDPGNPDAADLLGILTIRLDGATEDALAIYERALKRHPDNASLLNNYGLLFWKRNELEKAKQLFGRSVRIRPGWGKAWANLAVVNGQLGAIDDAVAAFRQSLAVKPLASGTGLKLARLLELQRRYEEALAVYDEGIRLRPDHAKTRYNRGLLHLKMGNYSTGWRDFEWRFAIRSFALPMPADWEVAYWDGSSFESKTLLIQQEQGFGDAIQMARYLPLVKARGGRILVRCRPRLAPLFTQMPEVDRILNQNMPLAETFDLYVSMMSLPHLFGTELDTIPMRVPYLQADPAAVDYWSERVDPSMFNVGLVWSGQPLQFDNDRRSCTLEDLAPLSDIDGVQFHSLQKGAASGDARNPPSGMRLTDFTAELKDFGQTAALMRNLDLIISVDTAQAHLAGALGHPVWVLLWSNHCWRYSLDKEESPWYPGMRLFRQTQSGSWADVVRNVASALDHAVQARRSTAGAKAQSGQRDRVPTTATQMERHDGGDGTA